MIAIFALALLLGVIGAACLAYGMSHHNPEKCDVCRTARRLQAIQAETQRQYEPNVVPASRADIEAILLTERGDERR